MPQLGALAPQLGTATVGGAVTGEGNTTLGAGMMGVNDGAGTGTGEYTGGPTGTKGEAGGGVAGNGIALVEGCGSFGVVLEGGGVSAG